MDVNTLLRKVKRQFGDEYALLVNDQDIYDWANEAQLDIVRDTSCNDTSVNIPANLFPYRPSGEVIIKRVAYNNRVLTQTTLKDLDFSRTDVTQKSDTPQYYYVSDRTINLWPQPNISDTYNINVVYATIPAELMYVAPYLRWDRINTDAMTRVIIPLNTTYHTAFLSFEVEIEVNDLLADFRIVTDTITNAANGIRWMFSYEPSKIFRLTVGNGTNTFSNTLTFSAMAIDTRYRLAVVYNDSTGIWYMYNVTWNPATLVYDYTLIASSTISSGPPITTGLATSQQALGNSFLGVAGLTPYFKLYYYKWYSRKNATDATKIGTAPLILFDGSVDLKNLAGIPQPFYLSSGQLVTIADDGTQTPQAMNPNYLELPEVYHEDIYKFCLARAHDKNNNFRAAEAVGKEYETALANRRHEAQSTDESQYKISDPEDYDFYGYTI